MTEVIARFEGANGEMVEGPIRRILNCAVRDGDGNLFTQALVGVAYGDGIAYSNYPVDIEIVGEYRARP